MANEELEKVVWEILLQVSNKKTEDLSLILKEAQPNDLYKLDLKNDLDLDSLGRVEILCAFLPITGDVWTVEETENWVLAGDVINSFRKKMTA